MRFKPNKRTLFSLSLLIVLLLGACGMNDASIGNSDAPIEEDDTVVAAVGDSITNYSVTGANYPDHLEEMLGEGYSVLNFGEANHAVQSSSDHPYETTASYEESLASEPDIIIFMLGTNDTKTENWDNVETFKEEYTDLLEDYLQLDSVSRVILASPPSLFINSNIEGGIDDAQIDKVGQVVEEVAEEYELEFVDVLDYTAGHDEWFFDGIHPNPEGAEELAGLFYEQIDQ